MISSKLVKLSSKGQIVIPKKIRKKLNVKPGDNILLIEQESNLLLENPARYSQLSRGSLKKTWGTTKEQVDSYLNEEKKSWTQE